MLRALVCSAVWVSALLLACGPAMETATPETPSPSPSQPPTLAPLPTPPPAMEPCNNAPPPPEAGPYFPDRDGDGFGDASQSAAEGGEGWVTVTGDCDDGDPAVHPGAQDPSGDGVDADCGGHDAADPHVGLSEASVATVAEAVLLAQDGATLWVGPGTWLGNRAEVGERSIAVRGTHGRVETILDVEGADRHFKVDAGGALSLQRLTLAQIREERYIGGGIAVRGGALTMDDCLILGSDSMTVEYAEYGNPKPTNHDNGGAIYSVDGVVVFRAGSMVGSSSHSKGGAVYISGGCLSAQDIEIQATTLDNRPFLGPESYWLAKGGALYANQAAVSIQGAHVEGTLVSGNGGFAYLRGGYAQIQGLVLTDSTAVQATNIFDEVIPSEGGAFYLEGAELTLRASQISGARADEGGAISGVDANLTLEEVAFTDCASGEWLQGVTNYWDGTRYVGNGGVIHCVGGVGSIRGGVMSENESAGDGGAVYWAGGGSLTLEGAVLSGNVAREGQGGGIFIQDATLVITDSTLSNNVSSSHGGGLSSRDGSIEITGSTFADNTSEASGGGAHLGFGAVSISNTLFTGNRAQGDGGGVSVYRNGPVDLDQLTVVENVAEGGGGGIALDPEGAQASIAHSILALNVPSNCLHCEGSIVDSLMYMGSVGECDNEVGEGNIRADPGFMDVTFDGQGGDNYHLHPTSPALGEDPERPHLDELGAYGGPGGERSHYEDSDGDGLYDGWELLVGLTVGADDSGDTDGDGLNNVGELLARSDPFLMDTDGDAFSDGAEVDVGANPADWWSRPSGESPIARVGVDFDSAQEALSAMQVGGAVRLPPGVFTETLVIFGLEVTLLGASAEEGGTVWQPASGSSLFIAGGSALIADMQIERPVSSPALIQSFCSRLDLLGVGVRGGGKGGGGISAEDSTVSVVQSSFVRLVDNRGGAIEAVGGRLFLQHAVFLHNGAYPPSYQYEDYWGSSTYYIDPPGNGGAIYTEGVEVRARQTRFRGNLASFGGALALDGGLLIAAGLILEGNRAADWCYTSYSDEFCPGEDPFYFGLGGGLWLSGATAEIIGGAITGGSGGSSSDPGVTGGGIWGDETSDLTLKNVLFAENEGGDVITTGALSASWTAASDLTFNGALSASECQGCIDAPPQLLSLGDSNTWADAHLALTSPLIDAGDPSLTDFDGSPVDIGPYGGPWGSGWDLDGDDIPLYPWPGSFDDRPEGVPADAFEASEDLP